MKTDGYRTNRRMSFLCLAVILCVFCCSAKDAAAAQRYSIDRSKWVTAESDVSWSQDSFALTHKWELKEDFGFYLANGMEGHAVLYESPVSEQQVSDLKNGTEVFCYYTWEDSRGNRWGLCQVMRFGRLEETVGWLPVAYACPAYGSDQFAEDYAEEIADGDSYNYFVLVPHKWLVLWTYPGSADGVLYGEFPDSQSYQYSGIYTDQDGQQWGWFQDFWKGRDYWICMDHPDQFMQKRLSVTVDPPEPSQIVEPDTGADRHGFLVRGCILAGVSALLLELVLFGRRFLSQKKESQKPLRRSENALPVFRFLGTGLLFFVFFYYLYAMLIWHT